jgi:copper chaperone CopZ
MDHEYAIEGMHCASCVAKVSDALEHVPGISRASVSLTPPIARLVMREPVPTSVLREAVAAAGSYRLSEQKPGAVPPRAADAAAVPERAESLYPLLLIVAYIAGAVLLIEAASDVVSPHRAMRHFMAGFFLVFSFFKLLDLRGFAATYRTYDVVAKHAPAWGWLYPFVELALGIAYLWPFNLIATNIVTLVLMLVGAVGVVQALLNRRAIRCACLGTVLNLPMTKITLVEDLGMAAMAAAMLLL